VTKFGWVGRVVVLFVDATRCGGVLSTFCTLPFNAEVLLAGPPEPMPSVPPAEGQLSPPAAA
jgi:hypothetical protein